MPRMALGTVHGIERRVMENSKPGNVYSIAMWISTLKITIIGPHCSTRRSNVISSLLECYFNVGQRLILKGYGKRE